MTLNARKRRRLGWILSLCFLGVMLMGPGPGLLLINPSPDDPTSPTTFLGLPVIYMWGLLWYSAQLAIIFAADRLLWRYEQEEPLK